MPLIPLLFLFDLQIALDGFHAIDLPDLCYDPLLGFFVMNEPIAHNISLY